MNDEYRTGPRGDLRERTKAFGLRVIKVCSTLGDRGTGGAIARQLVRCGTSVGAQYREACRARSVAEFISKVQSAAQELDETSYWFELLAESGLVKGARRRDLMSEADELMAILVSSAKTAKARRGRGTT